MMNEDRSILTEISFPVSPWNTVFRCAENAAAVNISPFLFCWREANENQFIKAQWEEFASQTI